MRLITERFIEQAWHTIATEEHSWTCWEHYQEDMENSIDEVDASAEATYLTKINSDLHWDVNNFRLVNIYTDQDWNKIQTGSIRYGGLE